MQADKTDVLTPESRRPTHTRTKAVCTHAWHTLFRGSISTSAQQPAHRCLARTSQKKKEDLLLTGVNYSSKLFQVSAINFHANKKSWNWSQRLPGRLGSDGGLLAWISGGWRSDRTRAAEANTHSHKRRWINNTASDWKTENFESGFKTCRFEANHTLLFGHRSPSWLLNSLSYSSFVWDTQHQSTWHDTRQPLLAYSWGSWSGGATAPSQTPDRKSVV